MTPDAGQGALVGALRLAVVAAPDNAGVRLQLAEALLGAREPEEALLHARTVLASTPDDVDALDVARRAARELGDDAVAGGYARLHDALSGEPERLVAFVDPEADGDDDGAGELGEEDVERPKITLADVGGMEQVKESLERTFLGPLRHPELRAMYGAELRGGLMLYGPPGCGKTLLARAVAGEMGARFLAVGLQDVLNMYIGESERRLHEVFEFARRNAPTVLFFDELDALGHKRGNLRGSAGRNTVNQLLAEMDGMDSDGAEGVFVLAATNHPWDVDAALRRGGRFDRTLLVLPPDRPARAAIVALHLRNRPTEGIDPDRIAKITDGFSGADLELVCRTAMQSAMADAMRTGTARPITESDLLAALKEIPASTRPWFSLAYNFAAFASEGGQYDDLLAYIRRHKLA